MRESPHDDREWKPEPAATPRFGRLLIVLVLAVLLIVAITFGSQAYFS